MALAVKKANGQPVGTVPYGFDLSADGMTLIPNNAEQAMIGEILTMRAKGMPLKRIAGTLTECGVPTRTGRSNRWTFSRQSPEYSSAAGATPVLVQETRYSARLESGSYHDDQLREPSVVDLTLCAGRGSQVFRLDGNAIPCFYFRSGSIRGRIGVGWGVVRELLAQSAPSCHVRWCLAGHTLR